MLRSRRRVEVNLMHILQWTIFSVVASTLYGCGGAGDPGTVPVSGTVKLDGQPLEGAEVFFLAEQDGWSARTDKEGYYQFSSGTKPLKFRVAISKFEGSGVVLDAESGMDEGQLMAMGMSDPSGKSVAAVAKQLVPEKFSNKEKTELTFTVPLSGTQTADFDISSN